MAKKEKYRLEPLLTIKSRQKRRCEIALAKSLRELTDEKNKLKELEGVKQEVIDRKAASRREMAERVAQGGARVRDSQVHLNYMRKLDADLEKIEAEITDQKEVLKRAEEKVKRARRDFIEAANELNMMEKHKELWQKKLTQKLNHLENKLMGELGNTVFQMNRVRES